MHALLLFFGFYLLKSLSLICISYDENHLAKVFVYQFHIARYVQNTHIKHNSILKVKYEELFLTKDYIIVLN